MASLDAQARKIVEKAVSEAGIAAQVEVVPVTSAMGIMPKEVMGRLLSEFNGSGRVALPAVLVDGKAVCFGVPDEGKIRSALATAKRSVQK